MSGRVNSELLQALKEAMKQPDALLPGVVKSLDRDKCVCVVDVAGLEYEAGLRSIEDGDDGAVCFPAEESEVIVVRMPGSNRFFVLITSEIEAYTLKVGDVEMRLDKDGFSLKKGDTTVAGDSTKLDVKTGSESLKSIISDLLDAILALTVTTGVGPSGTPINMASFQGIKTRLNNLLK